MEKDSDGEIITYRIYTYHYLKKMLTFNDLHDQVVVYSAKIPG